MIGSRLLLPAQHLTPHKTSALEDDDKIDALFSPIHKLPANHDIEPTCRPLDTSLSMLSLHYSEIRSRRTCPCSVQNPWYASKDISVLIVHIFFLLTILVLAAGKQTECLYDKFVERDMVTFSVFVTEALNNGKPRASINFEGPVSGNENLLHLHNYRTAGLSQQNNNENENERNSNENRDLMQPVGGRDSLGQDIISGTRSDWPKISGAHSPREVIQRKFKVDWTHAGGTQDAEMIMARAALLEKNHEEMRAHIKEKKGGAMPMHTIVQTRIEPYEETNEILAEGWYRLCVTADFMPLMVEMDMRTANKLKGINPGTGHVYTYQLREFLDEQEELFGKAQATDEDFVESKLMLKGMHELTSDLMKSQHDRMARIRAHDNDARRGAAALAWSSKFETLLYVVITGVQVYTVHKWLLSNQLGR